jgi:hypothetical protein
MTNRYLHVPAGVSKRQWGEDVPTVKRFSWSLSDFVIFHLPFRDRVHQLYAVQQYAGATKIPESQHWSSTTLDRPMVLFDNVFEVRCLTDPDRRFTFDFDGLARLRRGYGAVQRSRPAKAGLVNEAGLHKLRFTENFMDRLAGRAFLPRHWLINEAQFMTTRREAH